MFSHCKLGLLDHDPVRVGSVRLLPGNLLPVDPLISSTPFDWQLGRAWDGDALDNDVLSNCGPAALVNWQWLMHQAAGIPWPYGDRHQLTLDLYTAMGYDGRPETDNGVVLLDLLLHAQRIGLIDCFFRIGFGDPEHLATAVTCGPLIVGATLTKACARTNVWDEAAASDSAIWGGHAYLYHSHSPGEGSGKSWGEVVRTATAFRAKRWNEVYLPVKRGLGPKWLDPERLIAVAGQL